MIGDWVDKVSYPQMPALTRDELISFFEQEKFARLGTLNEDGSIHIAPIFFKVEDGKFMLASQCPSRKVRNIQRNPHVTLLIDNTHVPFKGALIYGKAELDYEHVIDKRIRIFQRRLSPEDARIYATRLSARWQCVIIQVTPTRIVSFDYSKG